MDVFVGVDVSETFFSVSASEDFKKKVTNSQSSIQYNTNVDARGGPNLPSSGTDPYSMQTVYKAWNDGLSEENAAGVKMIWRNWYDLQDVATIVDATEDETLRAKFTAVPPSTTIFQKVTDAYQEFGVIQRQIKQSKQWDCVKNNADYLKNLNDLNHQIEARVA